MRTIEICLDECVNRGYSGGTIFESDDVRIVGGSTNTGGLPKYNVLVITYKLMPNVELRGGPKEWAECCGLLKEIFNEQNREIMVRDFAYSLLVKGLTSEMLKDIVENSYETGVKAGRDAVKAVFRDLIGV